MDFEYFKSRFDLSKRFFLMVNVIARNEATEGDSYSCLGLT